MARVSVIIPTYNAGQYIKESVDSVLSQTYKDFEIIVIDDGSQDNTKHVLEEYLNEDRFTYIYQPRSGVSIARNAGIKKATGKYICFLDSDDLMLPENLEQKIFFSEKNKLKLVFSDYFKISSSSIPKSFENYNSQLRKSGYLNLLKAYSHLCMNNGSSYVLPKDIFLKIFLKSIGISTITIFLESHFLKNEANAQFDDKLVIAQDIDMWGRLLLNPCLDRVGYLDLPLAVYRFSNAKWMFNQKREDYGFVRFKKFIIGLKPYMKNVGREYLAETIWERTYVTKSNKYNFYFYFKIFTLCPWKLKYWKSFLGLLARSFKKTH